MKKAIFFMVASALAFTLLNIFVKTLKHFNVYQIVLFRSVGTLFFTIPLILKLRLNILGNKKKLLVARGIIGFMAMTLFFVSLKYLATGTAVSIRYISPIFAALFAIVLLNEKIRPIQWLYLAIAFSGVLVLKGFDKDLDTMGFLYVMGSTIFTGFVFIILRKIGKHDHPLVVVNYFMIISAIFAGILSSYHWTNPSGLEWLLLLSLGVFGYFGQFYMTKAFQSSEVNQIAPLKYLEVIFTTIFGIIWLGEIYSFINVLGIVIILSGLVLNFLSKTTN